MNEIGFGRLFAAQWHTGCESVRTGVELRSTQRHSPLLHGLVPLRLETNGCCLRSPADGHWPLFQRRLRRPFHENQPHRPHLRRRKEIGRATGTHLTQITIGNLWFPRRFSRYEYCRLDKELISCNHMFKAFFLKDELYTNVNLATIWFNNKNAFLKEIAS